MGWDVAGVVEATGYGVTRFEIGDLVYGMPRFPRQAGAYAEYVSLPQREFVPVPPGLDPAEAVSLGLNYVLSLIHI